MPGRRLLPIKVFTTPACPDCRALKAWFEPRGIAFVERDLRHPAIAEEAKRRTGVRVASITVVGRQAFCGTFPQQKPRILAALGLAEAA